MAATTNTGSQKQLVIQLRKIARDPRQCEALVRNPRCVEGLVQTLDSPDDECRLFTIQTLLMICKVPSGIPTLRKFGILEQKLHFAQDSPHQEIAKFSKKLINAVYPDASRNNTNNNNTSSNHQQNFQSPTMPHSSRNQSQHSQFNAKRPAANKSWQKNKRKKEAHKLKTIQLEIVNLNEDEARLKKVALKYAGVVDVVPGNPHSSFYAQQNVDKQDLIQFLRDAKFEVKALRVRKANALTQRPRNQMQRYDRNHESKRKEGKRPETLTERIKRQRNEAQEAKQKQLELESKQAEGWLSGAASYFW